MITARVEVYLFAFLSGHFVKKLRKLTRKGFREDPQVEINYDNSLGECLVDNQCLDDIFYFLECMAVGALLLIYGGRSRDIF